MNSRLLPHRMTLHVKECLEKGAVGAIGAVPGTCVAHPLDLIKIRLQTDSSSISFSTAAHATFKRGLFAGLLPGISQKVLTRGPMFFASELFTQAFEQYGGMGRERAVFVGSFASGYVTGVLASPAEWAKVQTGARPKQKYRTGAVHLVFSSIKQGQARSVFRIMRGAGLRNAVFDSTFFSVEHWLRSELGLPHAASFSLAAGVALLVDYPIDVAVKRNMAASGPVLRGSIAATVHLLQLGRVRLIYKGVGCKCMEFATSYFVTGAFAPLVLKACGMFAAVAVVSSSDSVWWEQPPDP
jgi:hypothetical protein